MRKKRKPFDDKKDKIVFLGTGGGRIVVFLQMRASGGLWFQLDGKMFVIDPGPGALVKARKMGIDIGKLKAIFISHRHLDHCADINSIIVAMTEGARKKKGIIFAPPDAIDEDSVILEYCKNTVENIIRLKQGGKYKIDDISLYTPLKFIHPPQTFGVIIESERYTISYIADTLWFDELPQIFQGDVVIMNTVFKEPRQGFYHLCIHDVEKYLSVYKPKILILNHFGMTLLRAKPWEWAERISKQFNTKVLAAWDNMVFDLDKEVL
ncbi:MAG: MBL fold metallo-hydrolase [Campylobacterota bacterium]|nr:MBL fold metallo-hydrolase [Campylobacterota bacterium]